MFIHAHAPVRIGIAGGGSDLPAWTRERPGRCLTLAVDHYVRAVTTLRPDKRVVAGYRNLDEDSCATEIKNGLIRETALLHGWEDGFEVHTLSEISSRGSGLGVSSAIAVALSAAFQQMNRIAGRTKDLRPMATDVKFIDGGEEEFHRAALEAACEVEINRLRRPIGRQDHAAAAHGGLRLYRFEGDRVIVERTFSDDDAQWLAAHLTLVRLPEGHDSRAILSDVSRAEQVRASYEAVPDAVRAIELRDLALLGDVLQRCHNSKRSVAGAVTDSVEAVISRLDPIRGVFGCKVTGAGGGGHVVAVAFPELAGELSRATGLPAMTSKADLRGVRVGWCA